MGLGRVVATDPVEVRLVEAAGHLPPLGARSTAGLERAGVAGGRRRLVDPLPFDVPVLAEALGLTPEAPVGVGFGVVGEVPLAEEGRPPVEIGQREERPDAG